MVRNYRKPLLIVAPKILLRSPDAKSSLSQMEPGSAFASVIGNYSKHYVYNEYI